MSLTVREKKSKVLFSPEELFYLKEAMENYLVVYYDNVEADDIYKDYGIPVKDDGFSDRKQKLFDKISKIFEASRVWDFEGFEYRP